MGSTLFEKIWRDHQIREVADSEYLLHIDRNFLHEISGAVSLKAIDEAKRPVRNPNLTFATIDHLVDTEPGRGMTSKIPGGIDFMRELSARVGPHSIRFFDLNSPDQGIVHVIAAELGLVLPGTTFVCGDSHTCTVGGIGAFGWGIGSTDSEHVLVTQTLLQSRPRTMFVKFDGTLPSGIFAKDMILALIGQHSASGGSGCALEFGGSAVRELTVEGRLTLCNMAVEFGARTGIVAPDDVTYAYLFDRPFAPSGHNWDAAVAYWRSLPSDPDAVFDAQLAIDVSQLAPQVTWGTSPEHVIGVDGNVPNPAFIQETVSRRSAEQALAYSGLSPGQPILGLPIQAAFIGSCTNARIEDLRLAARWLQGRKIARGVRAICTPGSTAIKRAAEAEGLHRIFLDAGFEWRESGCSFCMSGGAGGEAFAQGARVVTSTNRNFVGRQGPGVRSHLASPATVAASAVMGRITDVRAAGAH